MPSKENNSHKHKDSSSSSMGRIIKGQAHIQSSYNNTKVTIADLSGNVIAWSTAGKIGFKGAKKATPYAAGKVVSSLIDRIKSVGLAEVDVFVKGIGSGRESAVRALESSGLKVTSIKDVTPIPHNGVRPPGVRRV